jgi:hypothetical protein
MMTSHTNGKSGLTLIGLAAGAGSRFGGPKQLEPFGPGGETMLDFAIHDAVEAGFDSVVLVVRPEMREAFDRGVIARWGARVPIAVAFQEIPAGRKPWGTVDAVLAAQSVVQGGFAAVNADDYYGPQAYRGLADFLRAARHDATEYAVVGFPLSETMSASGGVTRALLRTSADGWLEHIEEVFDIERAGAVARGRSADGALRELSLDALVSMNMWGFTQAVFSEMRDRFNAFREEQRNDIRAELPLPTLVASMIRDGRARVRVLRGEGPWCGVTHPADRDHVSGVLRGVIERGGYRAP